MASPKPKLKCSVGHKHNTECGLSARYPSQKETIALKCCNREASNHLRSLRVPHSSDTLEYELILWRIGIFDNGKVDEMTVCPKHRNILGLSRKPSLSCAHPLRSSAKRGTCDRVIPRKMSQQIKNIWDVLVPIGSGKHAKRF